MKRSLFPILAFILFPFSACFAATNVPSSLSGDIQWDKDGSPYILQGKTVLPPGASLHIGPGVKVLFQGPAALEVDGTLDVAGAAAAPAVFDMNQAGLRSELFLNGADAHIKNAKFLNGVFLVRDSHLAMEGVAVTGGSGVYLQGSTDARLKSNKIYGNATGLVLDGTVKASLEFNTIVENTYGLDVKSLMSLDFRNNSIHGNQKEVINETSNNLSLGGNYWGTSDAGMVQAKVQGKVNLAPMKSLNDILRLYVRTQLPVITRKMSLDLAAKERREDKEKALALKEWKRHPAPLAAAAPPAESREAQAPSESQAPAPPPEVQASNESAASAAPEQAAAPPPPAQAESAPEAAPETAPEAASASPAAESAAPEEAAAPPPAPSEAPAPTGRAVVKALSPATQKLKPLRLPPDQGDVWDMAAAVPPANAGGAEAEESEPQAQPAQAQAPGAQEPPPAAASSGTIPLPPGSQASTPPPPPPVGSTNATSPAGQVPVPPEVSGSESSPETGSAPSPGSGESTAGAAPAPPSLDDMSLPEVPASASTAPAPPPVPSGSNGNASASSPIESVPPPPDLNEQVAPSANTATTAPPPPPVPAEQSESTASPAQPAPSASGSQAATQESQNLPPISTEPTAAQEKALQSLGGVKGDIDGMQAPPLDLGSDLSNPSTTAGPAGNGSNPPSNGSDLALPPIPDADVQPPKDLDLPPVDDLGNIDLDTGKK